MAALLAANSRRERFRLPRRILAQSDFFSGLSAGTKEAGGEAIAYEHHVGRGGGGADSPVGVPTFTIR